MSDWPRRYWMDSDGNIHRHDTEDMESNERRAVLVYPADQAPEPVAWVEKAIAQTWKLIDPLRPPPPGTYARGRHEGIALALSTLRDHLSNPPPSESAIRASERAKVLQEIEDAKNQANR